jgi:ATP-dependent RNA helicase RhlE
MVNGADLAVGKPKESVSTPNPGDFANFPEVQPQTVANL